MQIVIDLPEYEYNILKNYTGHLTYCQYLIKNGTPLPKGHGRLIDESDLTSDTDYEDGLYYAVSIGQINNAPTIINADKE